MQMLQQRVTLLVSTKPASELAEVQKWNIKTKKQLNTRKS